LVVADPVVERISEQGFGWYLSLAPLPEGQAGVLAIPAGVDGHQLRGASGRLQRILAIVREAAEIQDDVEAKAAMWRSGPALGAIARSQGRRCWPSRSSRPR
jgi:hypothetical protein